ncbi:MAG: tRNA (adenosine(37)-N6)-threonylcarbamoyltransferase complex ATPase subunit type 1 TsaE, partial [Actinomycetota bacterium]
MHQSDVTAVFDLPDEAATQRLGELLAPLLKPGMVIYLEGDLGAGKTTLVRALL